MPTWLLVRADGRCETKNEGQRTVHTHLGGPVTFIGAIPSLNAVILGRRDSENLPVHSWGARNLFFEEVRNVCGDIAIVASDDDGEEVDLDVQECLGVVNSDYFPTRPII